VRLYSIVTSSSTTHAFATTENMSSATIDPATGLQKYSCALCKERKIKCDRTEPCVACTKAGVACIFRAPEPPRRRKRRDSDADERKTEAEKRKIRKYEDMLRKAGVEVPSDEPGSGAVARSKLLIVQLP